MDPVRVRVVFEDRHVLTKSQRREGLKRCWVLLRPELDTVTALASHIVHCFALQDSCPGGLVLSMDRFVLPPFESTDIFKDKDVLSVRVRKRGVPLAEATNFSPDANRIEDSKLVDKQLLCLCDSAVVAEAFENESGGYQSEVEVDAGDQPVKTVCLEPLLGGTTGSKRKRDSDRLLSSKKKSKLTTPDEYPTVSPEAAEYIHLNCNENHSQEDGQRQGSSSRKRRSTDKAYTENAKSTTGKSMDHISEERQVEAQESGQKNTAELDVNGSNKKIPSRNSRRKKARRRWLRELKKSEKKELIQSDILENGTQQNSKVNRSLDYDNGDDEEVIPIVVKPGHIRFEPLGQREQPSHKPVEIIKWNGTVSKKKGQKWGREKNFSCRMSDDNSPQQLNVESVVEEDDKGDQLTEFEKLFPLTRLPKEGDVLAYRVVELSSSWCPELSPFRVGKVTSYDPTSQKTILVQVPEYPISIHEREEAASGLQPDNTLYKEDGSLEVDFSLLHDVRLFNEDKGATNATSTTERELTGTVSAVRSQKSGSAAKADHKGNGMVAQPTEKEQSGGWEEISRALDAKKAELSQKTAWGSWDRKETTTSSSWSIRALRRSALGPTVSLLRSKKNI